MPIWIPAFAGMTVAGVRPVSGQAFTLTLALSLKGEGARNSGAGSERWLSCEGVDDFEGVHFVGFQ